MNSQVEQTNRQAKQLGNRMRMGTGTNMLLHGEDAPTHYMDALERFKKDFASSERERRDHEKEKRQMDLEKKRLEQLERENRRWEVEENYLQKLKLREETSAKGQLMGVKKAANSNGLAYNPISLEYDHNPEGEKLKYRDQQNMIRRYVRAHNMDNRGNSKYNPLTGEDRKGIEEIIPQDLSNRYANKKYEHYDNLRLKVPSSANSILSHSPNNQYY